MDRLQFLGDEASVYDVEEAGIIILPVPFDAGSTWLKGSNSGPLAILEASPNLEFFDIETGTEVYREGIHTVAAIRASQPEMLVESVYGAAAGHLEAGRFVVTVGGNHTVCLGSVKAHAEVYKDLTVLQLDAHADLREEYDGSRYNHACIMARIGEFCPFVQVGIRSMDVSEMDAMNVDRTFFAHDIHDSMSWIPDAVDLLNEHVYITIDLDVFDPGIMPSTGTPEPGGLGWYQVLDLLREVAGQRKIVGFDVVELRPGANKAPDFLAAKLIYKLLSYIRR